MLPSRKTIIGKITLALEASTTGNIVLVTPDIIAADLIELGCDVSELPHILFELLENTNPDDYMERGQRKGLMNRLFPVVNCMHLKQ